MNKVLICSACGFQYDMLHNQPILLFECRHSICSTCLNTAKTQTDCLSCPNCEKSYQINQLSSSSKGHLRLNSQVLDLLNNLKNPKHQVKVRCVCGSQKTNLLCLNKNCKFEFPSCFDCSNFLHADCDTKLFVNKKKGFDKQIEISTMIRDLRSLEAGLKTWIGKEIAKLQNMLSTVIGHKITESVEISNVECIDFDFVRKSIQKLDLFYSKKQQKIIASLHDEKKFDHQLSCYVEAIKDSARENFGRLTTSIKAINLSDFSLHPLDKEKSKADSVSMSNRHDKSWPERNKKNLIRSEKTENKSLTAISIGSEIESNKKKYSLMFDC
jgi:hypothetical protein